MSSKGRHALESAARRVAAASARNAPIRARTWTVGGVVVRHVWAAGAHVARTHLSKAPPAGSGPDHLLAALAELGPTFVKLGQVLSTRPDLIPPRYEAVLSRLQDAAPPVPFAAVRAAIEHELGTSLDTAYATVDPVPIAAASIGQVHAATLPGGGDVVIKVRRPGVVPVVEQDLAVMALLAHLGGVRFSPLASQDLVGFVEEFSSTLRGELDYLAEGHNADRLRNELATAGVHVPEVDWTHTTGAVLTLERVRGVKIDDLAGLERIGVDRRRLAVDFARAYLTMVFVNGFFHADPHPGNIFVQPGGRLALVDFGMVGSISSELRAGLLEVLVSLTSHDSLHLMRALTTLGIVPAKRREAVLAAELASITSRTLDVPLRELRFAPLLRELMSLTRRHRLRLPRELALLVKAVMMCEGVAAQVDPDFALPGLLVEFASGFGITTQAGGSGHGGAGATAPPPNS